MQDLHNTIHTTPAINPQASTGASSAVIGAIIDTQGYDAIEFVLQTGTLYSGSTWTPSLEYGNDSALADTASVATTELIGTLAGATFVQASSGSNATKRIGYAARSVARKRYLRLTMTASSGGSSSTIGAIAVLSRSNAQPTT
jgi:hypothetical protein